MQLCYALVMLGIIMLPTAARGEDGPPTEPLGKICNHPGGLPAAERLTVAISYQDATPEFINFAGILNLVLINWWQNHGKQETDGIWCVSLASATTDTASSEPRAGITVYGLLGGKPMLPRPAVFSTSLRNRMAAADIVFEGIRGTFARATADHKTAVQR
ncbi:hypothetical protein C4552_04495 [Candidatus Parcubacteria bacterium]|nr:MAG: hypothetical protein C4552_04495 [Candidatus Parcubacteria bacterium]